MARNQGKVAMGVGGPLAHTLFLFSPPPGMTSADARKRSLIVFGVSLTVVCLSFALLKYLTEHKDAALGESGFTVLLIFVGSGFLLLPASLYRLIFGAEPPANGFTKFLRAVFALVLFLVTFIGSLIIYGQVSP